MEDTECNRGMLDKCITECDMYGHNMLQLALGILKYKQHVFTKLTEVENIRQRMNLCITGGIDKFASVINTIIKQCKKP